MGKLLKVWISRYKYIDYMKTFNYEVDIPLSELRISLTDGTLKYIKGAYGDKKDLIPYIMIGVSMKNLRNYNKRGFLKDPELEIVPGNIGCIDDQEYSRYMVGRRTILLDSEPFIEPLKKMVPESSILIPEDPEFKFLCQK
jgi:hypothetical protein